MIKNKIVIIVMAGLFLAFCSGAHADAVHLKNGRVLRGIIVSESQDKVRLKVGPGTMLFYTGQILSIERSTPEANAALKGEWQARAQKNEEIYNQAVSREVLERRLEEQASRKKELEKEYQKKSTDIFEGERSIFVDGIINGSERVRFLVDTGSNDVMLSEETALKLGYTADKALGTLKAKLADGSSVDCYVVRLDKVEVGQSWLNDVEAAVLPPKEGAPPGYDALLGMSFLKFFSFQIDYSSKKLVLQKGR